MTTRPGPASDAGAAPRALAAGRARGAALVLDEPLSFWGGMDPATGVVIDRRHPQAGQSLTGRVVAMPGGRGSSSSSAVLAESVRTGAAPAAVLLREPDPIVALGAMVAEELYGVRLPVVVVPESLYGSLRTGDETVVEAPRAGGSARVGMAGPGSGLR